METLNHGYCKDCVFLREHADGGNSCRHFGNPFCVDLKDKYGCHQFYKPKCRETLDNERRK